ncbi:MAG TPA: permease prefix domain 2-containing transporter [Vicinamibacterales bacterium]|jgi:hypothetical protein
MMTDSMPPRWADALLRASLRPSDRESISGDLLEDYRVSRQPTQGTLRANVWYVRQVFSVLWPLIRPAALVLAAQSIFLALTVFRPGHHAPHPSQEIPAIFVTMMFKVFWYGSVIGAPGVSLFDAAIYFTTAYFAARRTKLLRTGALVAAASSLVGVMVLYASAAIVTPSLIVATVANPPLVLIAFVHLLIVTGFSILIGMAAGVIGRWRAGPDYTFANNGW